MATIKIERGLNLGDAYRPEMGGGKRPEPTWATLRQQVGEAEALGYDTLIAVETQHDPYLTLAIAAQEPAKIELGTGIALAFTKSPVATAYTAWDLQRMSGGRLVLGLGSQVKGHITRRFAMPWSKPAQPEMPKLVSEEMVHAFAAVGTYRDIASVMKKRFAGVNRIGFDIAVRNEHDRGVLSEIVQDLRRP